MIDSKKLLIDLQKQVRLLEEDLRRRCEGEPEVDAPFRREYAAAKAKGRTGATYAAWRDGEITQVAVAWALGCVFVRFLEDNELVETPKLSGPGDRLRWARDEHELYFRRRPEDNTERGFLKEIFAEVGRLPAMRELFDAKHNPIWLAAPSGDACGELWRFWQRTDPETGALIHDFTDPEWNTRFLGDLYQDLSIAAQDRFALLQTPDFVEAFILDRTLTPALETFGLAETRLIDPTCGSGHFLLGAFDRLFALWQKERPDENPRVLAQKALDAVAGVDLNPFAVAIARFRLMLAALRVSRETRLKNAPDFHFQLAVGDSLIHGARFDSEGNPYVTTLQDMFGGEEAFQDETAHFFDSEDSQALHKILGRQYHAVVGNPPYKSVKDPALKQLCKSRYKSCYRKWVLAVPFMERFFDLTIAGSSDGRRPSGFTGQITSNSFMKREFGKKLVEDYIPGWDVTHVIDTSGAYIPGHGTPTVILLGRNKKPVAPMIRAVMGIKGEPSTPDYPSMGKVWRSIVEQVDQTSSESEFVSTADVDREVFYKHPWSIGGGGAAEARQSIEESCEARLSSRIDLIGFGAILGEDDVFSCEPGSHSVLTVPLEYRRRLVEGERVRDWSLDSGVELIFPYDASIQLVWDVAFVPRIWSFRSLMEGRRDFSKLSYKECGRSYWEYHQIPVERNKTPLSITFAEVATHNHFVLDRGGKVFKQTAPVIKLPADASEDDHLRLLGPLNSSVGCFWMQQVFHCKGGPGGASSKDEKWHDFYQFDGTKLKRFPLPPTSPLTLTQELDRLAGQVSKYSPDSLVDRDAVSASDLDDAEALSARLKARMIAYQEELDWQCYQLYGLLDSDDSLNWPLDRLGELPELQLGERAFEIVMARQNAKGQLQTKWFSKLGAVQTVEPNPTWSEEYKALVAKRIGHIENNKNIGLIERTNYKRRWEWEPWAKRQQAALRQWLLARLEGYFFEGERVRDLKGSFDPGAEGFVAATRPQLVSVNQLADVVAGDRKFLEAAEVYEGASGFSLAKLIGSLVEGESVPYLPALRYKNSGLRKRRDWESTWERQRQEDAVEALVRAEAGDLDAERLKTRIRDAQRDEVGDIPVPPKYASKDFRKTTYWKLRGKLDVPKERWIVYPGAERAGDTSPVIAWAGWDHLQQAQALAEYFIDAKDNQGWGAERLTPLLAGLADLLPWLQQWHNEFDPNYGMGLGDYFEGFLEEQTRALGLTRPQVDAARFGDGG